MFGAKQGLAFGVRRGFGAKRVELVGAPARGLGRLTSVLRVAVLLPTTFQHGGEFLADVAALETAGAYAELIEGADPVSLVVLGALAAATHRVQVGCVMGEALSTEACAALDRISGGRAMVFARGEPPERFTVQGAAGVAGLIVPWDPRLIDLLRNPDVDDDRSDLQMSTG